MKLVVKDRKTEKVYNPSSSLKYLD